MRAACRRGVEYSIGRRITENEENIYTARLVERLRQMASKERDWWNSTSRIQHMRGAGDRMFREIPDQMLNKVRAQTDALINQLEEVERQIALVEGGEAASTALPGLTEDLAPGQYQQQRGAGIGGLYNGDEFYNQEGEMAPGFYSALERAVVESKTNAARPAQWRSTLQNVSGVKKAELEWVGVLDWLAALEEQDASLVVTREQVLDFVRANGVQVNEVVLTGEGTRTELTPAQQTALRLASERLLAVTRELADVRAAQNADPNFRSLRDLMQPLLEATNDANNWTREHSDKLFEDFYAQPLAVQERDLEQQEREIRAELEGLRPRVTGQAEYSSEKLPGGDSYREILLTLPNAPVPYTVGHYDVDNVLGWARVDDRTDTAGRRILFIEEIQSDWGQAARRVNPKTGEARGFRPLPRHITNIRLAASDRGEGWVQPAFDNQGVTVLVPGLYFREDSAPADPANNESIREAIDAFVGNMGVAPLPFKGAWPALVLKRLVRVAAEQGYDAIAWTTGQTQAQRYNLDMDNIIRIEWDAANEELLLYDKVGKGVPPREELDVSPDQLAAHLGDELAEQLLQSKKVKGLNRLNLDAPVSIRHNGMRAFYDRILPNLANDLGKKHGARVSETTVSVGDAADAAVQDGTMDEDFVYEGDARVERFETAHMLPITPALEAMAMEGQAYFHTGSKVGGETVIRGKTEFYRDQVGRIQETVVRLTEHANFSTFVHETGHIWLEMLRDLAADPAAGEDVQAMWADVMDWFGLTSEQWDAFTRDKRNPYHEQFARTFEAYLKDGKAPSIALRSIFQQFKQWLVSIYRAMTLQHKLDPKIRNVFDRLIASDAEIEAARIETGADKALFQSAAEAGMSEQAWQTYLSRRERAEEEARAALTKVAMDAYYRQQTAWWNRELAKKRRTAAREIDTQPARRAHDWLAYQKWRGEVPRGPGRTEADLEPRWSWVDAPEGLPPMRINQRAVLDHYGDDVLANLPLELRPIDEAHIADLMEAARAARSARSRRNQPTRLASFVQKNGGIKDDGGEVRDMLGGNPSARPGLINRNGRSPDDMALLAYEAGFFGAKPPKGAFQADEHYQEDYVPPMAAGARLENVRVTPATEGVQPRLGQVISIRTNDPGADFYIVRRGTPERVGSVTREFNPEHYGVRITAPEVVLPQYLYYALQYVHSQGYYEQLATGTTRLVNIRQRDILNIPLGERQPGEPETRAGNLAEGEAWLDSRPPLKPDVYYSEDNRPTLTQFFEALAADLRGDAVYKVEELDEAWSREEDLEWAHWFEARDIDIGAPAAELRAQIEAALRRELNDPEALHPDVIAEYFGFTSGEELLKALGDLRPRREVIEEMAQKMVRDEFGDPFEDGSFHEEALHAAHRAAQSRVIELELEALDRATGGKAKPLARAARRMAEQRVANWTVREIRNYRRLLGQERKHARLAIEALERGDKVTASLEKKAQLVAFHTYAVARDAAQTIERTLEFFKSMENPRTRLNINDVQLSQVDQLLEQFELKRISLTQERRRISLAAWALRMEQQGLGHLVNVDPRLIADSNKRPFSQLTWDEVQGLRDTIRNLVHLGRKKETLLIKRERQRIQDVENEIVARIEQTGDIGGDKREGIGPTLAERANELRRKGHAEQSKMEVLFRILDGVEDNGPVWRHLFRPIAEGEATELEMGALAAARLQKIFSVYSKKERAQMFSVRRMVTAVGRPMVKTEIMMVALNWGNLENRKALMEGYQWNEEQVRAILDNLDERDWQVVQDIFDWLDEYREPAFDLHERMTGVRPQAVQPEPIITNYGTIRGGYFPLRYDYELNMRAFQNKDRQEKLEEFGGNFIRPATRQGHLQARVGSAGQPVRLDLTVLQEHVTNVIHDIAFREAVIDTLRLIERPAIQDAIIAAVGIEQYKNLRPWLADIAVPPPAPHTLIEMALTRLATNATVVAMGWKVSTAIVQPLGIINSIPRIGGARLMKTLPQFIFDAWNSYSFVTERSTMMRFRRQTFDRDVREALATIRGRNVGDPIPLGVRQTFFWAAGYLDVMTSGIAWKAAYDAAMAGEVANVSPLDEDAAVQHADSVVRTTQGSGSVKDQSKLMRRRDVMRAFTMFMTFMSALYNQFWEQGSGFRQGRIPFRAFVGNIMLIWFVSAILAEAFQGRLHPEDDESDEDFVWRIAKTVIAYPAMTIIGLRDLVGATISDYGYEISPVGDAGEAIAATFRDTAEGDFDEQTVKNAMLSSGYLLGLPARQVWTTSDYLMDASVGLEDPAEDPGSIYSEGLLRDRR